MCHERDIAGLGRGLAAFVAHTLTIDCAGLFYNHRSLCYAPAFYAIFQAAAHFLVSLKKDEMFILVGTLWDLLGYSLYPCVLKFKIIKMQQWLQSLQPTTGLPGGAVASGLHGEGPKDRKGEGGPGARLSPGPAGAACPPGSQTAVCRADAGRGLRQAPDLPGSPRSP